ncbi:MAG: hypothetical protein IJU77_09410 [Butyrivibrio sp.]|nr:hypothetical protein [Butyrivibrio sp.]
MRVTKAKYQREGSESIIEDYKEELKGQVEQLNYYIKLADERLKKSKRIEKRVVCTSTRKNGFQYYLMEDGKRAYVKAKDMDAVRNIVQKDYDESIYNALVTVRYRIERFLKLYDVTMIDDTYRKMSEARKRLVEPLIPTDEQYVEEWYLKHKDNQNTFPVQGTYLTARGESVRSKSEKIIADLFDKYDIPYRYEPMLKLKDGRGLFPDFAVLNVRRRRTFYWEHFGLITDGEYAKKTLHKLNVYEESGYVIGEDILFSTESDTMPLNVGLFEQKIRKHLL